MSGAVNVIADVVAARVPRSSAPLEREGASPF
jgi:hypothetical protein